LQVVGAWVRIASIVKRKAVGAEVYAQVIHRVAVGVDGVGQEAIPGPRPFGDTVVAVEGDEVGGGCRVARGLRADNVAGRSVSRARRESAGNADTVSTVCERTRARRIGADAVALHLVARDDIVAVNEHSVRSIAGDEVARASRGTSQGVSHGAIGAMCDAHAGAIRNGSSARDGGANVVALYQVASGIGTVRRDEHACAVAGDEVAGGCRGTTNRVGDATVDEQTVDVGDGVCA
jgi:hypothetical protein